MKLGCEGRPSDFRICVTKPYAVLVVLRDRSGIVSSLTVTTMTEKYLKTWKIRI